MDLVRCVGLAIFTITASTITRRRRVGRWTWFILLTLDVVSARLQAVRQASLTSATVRVVTTSDNTRVLEPIPCTVATLATITSVAADTSVFWRILDVLAGCDA